MSYLTFDPAKDEGRSVGRFSGTITGNIVKTYSAWLALLRKSTTKDIKK